MAILFDQSILTVFPCLVGFLWDLVGDRGGISCRGSCFLRRFWKVLFNIDKQIVTVHIST